MSAPEFDPTPSTSRNEDPITHEPGAHPVAAGVGAAGGGATGAAIGLVLGGPVGGVIGAVIGAVAGGLGGSAVGESVSPTVDTAAPVPVTAPSVMEISTPEPAEEIAPAGLQLSEVGLAPSDFSAAPAPLASALSGHGVALEQAAEDAVSVSAPSHEEIALGAWSRYEEEGRPDGQDLRHWLEAEQSLSRGQLV